MQIVIDIPDETVQYAKELPDTYHKWNLSYDDIIKAIRNGKPLPKGHGRLIDADRLYDDFEYADYDFEEALEYAPTIIEADEEAESENRK